MLFLSKEKYESCLEFLQRAEILSAGAPLLKAITYNNFAQHAKKVNKLKTAISYLEKSLEIEVKHGGDPILLADTHLNLCAIFSSQDRHIEALEHILIAVVLLQDEYNSLLLKKISDSKNSKNNSSSKQEQ
jgi:tetratricopeptide (TPR) repeat protein